MARTPSTSDKRECFTKERNRNPTAGCPIIPQLPALVLPRPPLWAYPFWSYLLYNYRRLVFTMAQSIADHPFGRHPFISYCVPSPYSRWRHIVPSCLCDICFSLLLSACRAQHPCRPLITSPSNQQQLQAGCRAGNIARRTETAGRIAGPLIPIMTRLYRRCPRRAQYVKPASYLHILSCRFFTDEHSMTCILPT